MASTLKAYEDTIIRVWVSFDDQEEKLFILELLYDLRNPNIFPYIIF